jgi:hypothetical protein
VQEYAEQLAVGATIAGSAETATASGAFSASTDFQRVTESLLEENKFFSSSVATCTAYVASLTTGEPQFFSPGFVNSVENLPTTFDDSNKAIFFDFLNNFGAPALAIHTL